MFPIIVGDCNQDMWVGQRYHAQYCDVAIHLPEFKSLHIDPRVDNFPLFNQRFQKLLDNLLRHLNLCLSPINAELFAICKNLGAI